MWGQREERVFLGRRGGKICKGEREGEERGGKGERDWREGGRREGGEREGEGEERKAEEIKRGEERGRRAASLEH